MLFAFGIKVKVKPPLSESIPLSGSISECQLFFSFIVHSFFNTTPKAGNNLAVRVLKRLGS